MKISELIEQLQALKDKHGDLAVKVHTLSHAWAPEPIVKYRTSMVDGSQIPTHVCLNP